MGTSDIGHCDRIRHYLIKNQFVIRLTQNQMPANRKRSKRFSRRFFSRHGTNGITLRMEWRLQECRSDLPSPASETFNTNTGLLKGSPSTISYTLSQLTSGAWYFGVTALDTAEMRALCPIRAQSSFLDAG